VKTHFKSNPVITELLVLGGRGISSINKCNKRQQMKRVTNSYLYFRHWPMSEKDWQL